MKKLIDVLKKLERISGEVKRRQDEERLLKRVKDAEKRAAALRAVVERDQQVENDYEKTRKELLELRNLIPRGDPYGFLTFCLPCAYLFVVLFFAYPHFAEMLRSHYGVSEIWSGGSWWCEYRPFWTQTFRIGFLIMSWKWSLVVFAALLGILWLAQHELQRRHARTLIKVFSIVVFAGLALLLVAACAVQVGPMVHSIK